MHGSKWTTLQRYLGLRNGEKRIPVIAAQLGLENPKTLTGDQVYAEVEQLLLEADSFDDQQATFARERFTTLVASNQGTVARTFAGDAYILLGNVQGKTAMPGGTGWTVKNPTVSFLEGEPVTAYQTDAIGAKLLSNLTSDHVGRMMAVVLDEKVLTTPVLRDRLSNRAQISGGFTQEEAKWLADLMRSGSLEAQIDGAPISTRTIGSSIGEDNKRAGLQAALTALILVAIFMVIYYFVGGMVANFALVGNLVLILGIMSMMQSTFTLPGIAGMVLTIGMAVDANVLIFERIREEMKKKELDTQSCVDEGFGKALSTILDAEHYHLAHRLDSGGYATNWHC